MNRPLIITVGREYGSSGREIGKILSAQLQIPFYDKEKLLSIAKQTADYEEVREFYEEKPMNSFLAAIEENEEEKAIARKPFRRIRMLMGEEGGVIIGRCGNCIFRNYENALSVFIHASQEVRIQRIAQMEQISLREAKRRMKETDEDRAVFHCNYTGETWGGAKGYELCLDSGILGVQGCADMILKYLQWKKEMPDIGQ